jgi:hypothetical protein
LAGIPTIQPVATDTNVGDTISRQQAINAMAELQGRASSKGELTGISKAWKRIKKLPPIQPEPAIPLSWIEKHIEWHKSLDNEFANLAAAHISVMVKKWRDEQNETD